MLTWLIVNLGSVQVDPRKFAFSISFAFNAIIVLLITIKSLTNEKDYTKHYPALIISVFSLTMHVTSLHSAEVFRLATSTSIGFGTALYLLAGKIHLNGINLNLRKFRLPVIAILFFIVSFSPGFFFGRSSSNYFPVPTLPLPSGLAFNENKIPYFKDQRWGDSINQFYISYYKTMTEMDKNSACNLTHYFNPTGDGFLATLTRVLSLYKIPWLHENKALISAVNPDYINLKESSIKSHSLLILSKTVIEPPDGYILIDTIKKDFIRSYTHFKDLYIYGPGECGLKK